MGEYRQQPIESKFTKKRRLEFLERFYDRFHLTNVSIRTERRLDELTDQALKMCFNDIGKNEFITSALPKLRFIYGNNIRALGKRIKEIFTRALKYHNSPEKLRAYFNQCVSQSEVKFAERRDQKRKRIIATINETIREYNRQYSGGVQAVVIIGSYAQMTFTKRSDLDIICITKSSKSMQWLEGEDINYCKRFRDMLRKKMSCEVTMPDNEVHLSNLEELTKLKNTSPIHNNYFVVTPYDEVRGEIQKYLP